MNGRFKLRRGGDLELIATPHGALHPLAAAQVGELGKFTHRPHVRLRGGVAPHDVDWLLHHLPRAGECEGEPRAQGPPR